MNKPTPEHFDKIGNLIHLDDVVAVADHNSLFVGKVVKLNNKMIKVDLFQVSGWGRKELNKYPSQVVRIPPHDATMYLLKT